MQCRVIHKCFLFCAAALAFNATCHVSMAALMTGDIAIIGLYTDGTSTDATGGGDSFAWVPLVNLTAGEVIHFSDAGYFTATPGFNSSEGLLTFTVPAGGISAGAVQTASNDAAPNDLSLAALPIAGTGYTTGASAYSSGGHINLSGAGDQIVAFQDGDVSDITGFNAIFAANNASDNWTPGVDVDDSNQTNLYPGLTDGVNAVALGSGAGNQDEFDNTRYTGTTIGTPASLLAAIANAANWEKTNDSQTAPSRDWATNGVSQFTIVPEPTSAALLIFGLIGFLPRRKC